MAFRGLYRQSFFHSIDCFSRMPLFIHDLMGQTLGHGCVEKGWSGG